MNELEKIGFIGLGNMGFNMASNLLKAGYSVYGIDINPKAEQRFADIGGIVGNTIETIIDKVDIIMTSLTTPDVVENVYLGENGLIRNGNAPLILIDLSTISPSLNEKIYNISKQNNIQYLGAPVSGAVEGAIAGTLSVMVGGERETYDRVISVFEAIGKNIFYISEKAGSGSAIKLLNNFLTATYSQAVAEMFVVADQLGVDKTTVYDVLSVSSASSVVLDRSFKSFISKNEFTPGFALNLMHKDVKLFKKMVEDCNSNLLLGSKLLEHFDVSLEKGYGDKDVTAVYLAMKELNNS